MPVSRAIPPRVRTEGREGETNNTTAYRNPGVSAREAQTTDVYEVEIAVKLLAMARGVDGRGDLMISCGPVRSFRVVVLLHRPILGYLKRVKLRLGQKGGVSGTKRIATVKAETKEEGLQDVPSADEIRTKPSAFPGRSLLD